MTTIITDEKLDYQDVLMVPQNSVDSELNSRSKVELITDIFGVRGIGVIAANMDGVGTFAMAESLSQYGMFTTLVKHYSVDDLVNFYTDKANSDIIPYTIYSMGANESDILKFEEVLDGIQVKAYDLDAQTEPRIVCIDVANGYTESFLKFIARFREEHPSTIIVAGNVCTPYRTAQLIAAGANYVKVGIGPGSVCSTRLVTGVGYPQFSAVVECAEAAYEAHGAVIADGGCVDAGDIAKAFGAGAAGVMLGGMLAGHEEGETPFNHPTTPEGVWNRPFYGMASRAAQNIHNGGVKDYRSSEGREVTVPYRGKVEGTVLHILGGLRSACLYNGVSQLNELQNVATFVKVRRQANEVFVK